MKGISYKYFLTISLFFGILYIFIIPPFQAPDEDAHLFRSYELGNIGSTIDDNPENRLGAYLPTSLFDYSDQFRYLRFDINAKISWEQLSLYNEKNLEKVNKNFIDFSNTAMYFPTAYPLHSVFAFVASRLNLRPATLLYLLRFASLLSWLLIAFYIFRLLPHDNLLFPIIFLLPSLLVLHCSVTADVITNALSFFLVTFILSLRNQQDQVSNIQLTLLGFLILIISINKIVYFPLIILWFLLPFGKLESKKKYFLSFFIIASISIACTSLWSLKVNGKYITYEEYHPEFRDDQQIKPNGHPTKQLNYILSNPYDFFENVLKSYASVIPASLAHLTGKFGWEKNYIPTWTIGILAFLILFLLLSSNFKLTSKEKLIFLISVTSTLFLLAMVMYGLYSSVGNDYIHNLGGKYLFPILPGILILFSGKFLKLEVNANWFIAVIILTHITMLFAILNRYYF